MIWKTACERDEFWLADVVPCARASEPMVTSFVTFNAMINIAYAHDNRRSDLFNVGDWDFRQADHLHHAVAVLKYAQLLALVQQIEHLQRRSLNEGGLGWNISHLDTVNLKETDGHCEPLGFVLRLLVECEHIRNGVRVDAR